MRGLSEQFFYDLKSGFLASIPENIRNDPDLDLEIRAGYINIYYKGKSLLKLAETRAGHYKREIHPKFLENIELPVDFTSDNISLFLNAIPLLKQNITKHGQSSLEVEYEQMIIRANNLEPRNAADYYIVDRQYAVQDERFDLTGIFWQRRNRRQHQEVPICLLEIKFALNSDISEIDKQLTRYYEAIKPRATDIAEELQAIFRQKIELGLIKQPQERLNALKTLVFSKDITQFQFIVVLVDYNPNSSHLNLENLAKLPFANQIKIFRTGFAMWEQNIKPL